MIFFVKMEGLIYRRWVKHCFLLNMDFVANNPLFSASLSLTMFIFLLNAFSTWDYYYSKSNLTLPLYVKVLLI